MPFNFALLREIRLKDGIGRKAFAELLGISDDYLYRYESGLREPGVAFVEKLSRYSGVPVGAFLEQDEKLPETPGRPSEIKTLVELINSANRERYVRKVAEERVAELESLNEHLMAVNELCVRYARIQSSELTKPEKAKSCQ
jgi:transcriptional regulator with XRE-family HTH domain